MEFENTIGLETHVQLKTKTKMFCSCLLKTGCEPNTNVCPVCLGYPGALPVMNKEAVKLTVMSGMMLGCETKFHGGLGGFVARHDDNMETSLHGIYIAGDVSGIEEASVAIVEGKLAGLAASEALGYIPRAMADELKGAARKNLAELRSGERGARIAGFKKEIML